MPYDGAVCARQEARQNNIAGVASGSMTKFLFFARTKVKKVHALVCAVGTNTAAGIDIYNGTTSVGEIVLGTNTAGYTASSGLLDTIVPAKGMLEIKGKANSATTLVVSLSVEHEPTWDSVIS